MNPTTSPCVLYLTTVYPGHKKTGGDVCSQRYVDALRHAGAQVDEVAFLRKGDAWPQQSWEHIAEERMIETAVAGLHAPLWMARSLLSGAPYSEAKYHSTPYVRTVQALCAQRRYDFCMLDHASRMIWMLKHLPPGLPVVANTHNIEHQLYERLSARRSGLMRQVYAREARLVRAVEERLPRFAREIWCVTGEDGAYYSAMPNAPRVRAFETPPSELKIPAPMPAKRFDVGLLGNWQWMSNLEGLEWFASQALPHLPPELSVEIAGKGADWMASRHARVILRGFVPSAEEFLCAARVVAIPSTSGAGVQIKMLDSIALGLPVVATSFAVRGIQHLPRTVQVTDDPRQFCRLLAEAAARPSVAPDPEALAWADDLRRRYTASIAAALCELSAGAA